MDCYIVKEKVVSKKKTILYPVFLHKPSRDIMVRDGKFYAIWNKNTGLWSTSRTDAVEIIDEEMSKIVAERNSESDDIHYVQAKMVSNDIGVYDAFNKWAKDEDDNFEILNQKVLFNNSKSKKTDYCSFKLPYDIADGSKDAYIEMVTSLYDPDEIQKIEWAIGCIIAGDVFKVQKAIALYGAPGTGKSTILDIIAKMFKGTKSNTYTTGISTKGLGDKNNQYATGPLKKYKLVLIDNDANLSNANDNSVLNKIIAHDELEANPKYGKTADVDKTGLLFLATNTYINMSDAKSGLRRRVIIVKPKGETIEYNRYIKLKRQINNEFGSIAYHCLEVYKSMGADAYNDYLPLDMFELSNPIYNWLYDTWDLELSKLYPEGISLNDAWSYYKQYCIDSGFKYGSKNTFKADMCEYFDANRDGYINKKKTRYFYTNFKSELFDHKKFENHNRPDKQVKFWLDLSNQHSLLDDYIKDYPVQYSNKHSVPRTQWSKVVSKLSEIDTSKEHFVKLPTNMVVIDFDTEGATPEDTLRINKELAAEWPETYCETSRSGCKLHLHYIYDGDVTELQPGHIKDLEKEGYKVEVKYYTGDSSLRRKLSLCNDVPIAHLTIGDLPLKEKKKKNVMINQEAFKDNAELSNRLINCMNKEYHDNTGESVNLIKKILDDAYASGKPYDVRALKSSIINFAGSGTNSSARNLHVIKDLHYCSDNCEEDDFVDSIYGQNAPIVIYDIECFPNLFVICWKYLGAEKPVNKMINPMPSQVLKLMKNKLVGHNVREYDNHMLVAAANGFTNKQLYSLSKKLVSKDKTVSENAKSYQNKALSYADTLDYPTKKQGLKDWEIDLGIDHVELGLDWDSPVPEELWSKVADYCSNDVIATEAVWNATQEDFLAREILAEIAGGTPNDKTNSLSIKFVFEGNKYPQSEFNYRFMGEVEPGHKYKIWDDGITCFQDDGKPIFLGYKFDQFAKTGKSKYLDVDDVGEGGYVYAETRYITDDKNKEKELVGGIYHNVWTFDVASMHPSTVIAENLFGDYYTNRFKEIVELRIAIKHGDFDKAKTMFNGKLAKYLDDPNKAKALASALKIVINSVYGLTASTKYETAFRDKRNIDNIVAKRGSLFMINLRNLVQKKGYTVVHCKTDSIKVENPDQEIYDFIMDYGRQFGYEFEIEHKFEKICLVDNSQYIAKLSKDDPEWIKDCKKAKEEGKPEPTRWTATGKKFQVPYVMKTLFTHNEIEFEDLCIKNKVKDATIYLDFNENLEDVSFYEKCLETKHKIDKGLTTTKKAALELEDLGADEYELKELIARGHSYMFVGKVGLFCPVKEGTGGGELMAYREDTKTKQMKYVSVNGAKGYRWKEATVVESSNLKNTIDYEYFEKLADDAMQTISQFGNFEEFAK